MGEEEENTLEDSKEDEASDSKGREHTKEGYQSPIRK
jgi:hypothetical protein